MNWDAIGAVGEILGVVAVVASLFYVGRQMKQTALAIRGQTFEGLSSATNESTRLFLSDPQLIDITKRGLSGGGLSPDEISQYNLVIIISLRHAEAAHYQYVLGLLDTHKLKSLVSFAVAHLGTPIGRSFWESTKIRYDDVFIAYIEELMEEIDPELQLGRWAVTPGE